MIATFGQLYVFAYLELGKGMVLFGAALIVLANVLGLLVLKEALPPNCLRWSISGGFGLRCLGLVLIRPVGEALRHTFL